MKLSGVSDKSSVSEWVEHWEYVKQFSRCLLASIRGAYLPHVIPAGDAWDRIYASDIGPIPHPSSSQGANGTLQPDLTSLFTTAWWRESAIELRRGQENPRRNTQSYRNWISLFPQDEIPGCFFNSKPRGSKYSSVPRENSNLTEGQIINYGAPHDIHSIVGKWMGKP